MTPRHPDINRFIVSSLPQRPGQQRDLADAVGVSEATVSRWLSYDSSPSPDLWPKLAEFFHVMPAEFDRMAQPRTDPGGDALHEGAEMRRTIDHLLKRVMMIETALGGQEAVERKAREILAAVGDHAMAAGSGEDPSGTDPGPKVGRPSPEVEPDEHA